MRTLSVILIGLFSIISLVDISYSWKALHAGYYETHILSGLQYGLYFAAILKIFEIVIIAIIASVFEKQIDEKIGVPASQALILVSCLFGLAGASCTFLAIPGLI
jgi:uncharacterized membrane protein